MRPISRVEAPKLPNGENKIVSDYKDWRQDLINAFGEHCAYCNQPLSYEINVEHVVAKSIEGINSTDWNNLLLACGPCNWVKNDAVFQIDTHYLPDVHNTHLAFKYIVKPHPKMQGKFACIPIIADELLDFQKEKAQKVLDDLKLQRIEQDKQRTERATDIRWLKRYNAFECAKKQLAAWESLATDIQKNLFLDSLKILVNGIGFFSIWYQFFAYHPQALAVIINASPNTDLSSFDVQNDYKAIPRNENDL